MSPLVYATLALAAGLIIFLSVMLLKAKRVLSSLRAAEQTAQKIIGDSKKEAENIKKELLLEAKDKILTLQAEAERQTKERRQELHAFEKRLATKEESLDRRDQTIAQREKELSHREKRIAERERSISHDERRTRELLSEHRRQLEAVAGLSVEEAKRQLVRQLEAEARREAAFLAKRIEDEARASAVDQAKEVIATCIQRCASEQVVETAVSVVDLPNDEMKGRIIGKEGRNIRALEVATGVDLIIDDTPEAIILSGFDPVRREVAKLSIERLISDGRIHPARIEEVVEKVKKEIDEKIFQEGEGAALELGIHDFHHEIIRLLGRLKYRTSYGQNVLNHSKDVAYLAGMMAAEIGANVKVARRAGLIHDIGKAVDREVEGTHIQLGVQLARKCGESEEVIHAMEAHHFDVEFRTIEAQLVQAADALSAARPGARREILETYVKRLEKLENLADSFEGVAKCYAIQAGREIRVMVESDKVSDEQAYWLTKDIARKIENELQYPGQIKVTVIREMRVVDYAR
ncbi:MAG: ribonuclease Y [Acidobacteriota bacterium]